MSLDTIQPLIDWIAAHPDLSGLIIFLIACSESLAVVGIVIPGVVFMLSIGTLVGLGAINLWSALIWAALGAITGDWVSYWLGRHFDRQIRHVWPLSRYPKLVPTGEKFFKRHGGKSVMFGRFVGPLRPIIPAVAGIMHMSQPKFYLMNFMSAILWAPVVILPGVAFGNSLQLAQAVFGKLIFLVVILILLGAMLGFIAKHVMAYTLMTTVNTWGEFFGFDKAREHLASFSIAGLLIVCVAMFVYQYESRYQEMVIEQEANSVEWWENNWNIFSPFEAREKQISINYPIAIQWWGSYENIKLLLNQNKWQMAEPLTFKNSLYYFLSDPDIKKLPARRIKLLGSYEKLTMVKSRDNGDQFSVLRLWPLRKKYFKDDQQLWLGVIYNVDLVSPLGLFNFAFRDGNYTNSISQFKSDLEMSGGVNIQQKYYSHISRSDNWRGEVLLLSFKRPPEKENKVKNAGEIELSRQTLSGTSISLEAPDSLTGSKDAGFSYEKNGVVVRIKRQESVQSLGGSSATGFSQVSDQVREQLKYADNLQLISLNERSFVHAGMRGTQFTANYDIPPFGKQLIYTVKVMEKAKDIWIATGIAKQCDTRGKQVVNAMLDSIAWQR